MTALEAIRKVNDRMTAIGLKDNEGDPIEGIMCVGIVSAVAPMEWSQTEDLLENGILTPDEYAFRLMEIIERFERARAERRLRRKVSDLALDQAELDLTDEVGSA